MKKYIYCLLFVSLISSFIPLSNTSSGIKVIFDSNINKRLRGPIGKAALAYYAYYGCPDTTYIHYGTLCRDTIINDSSKEVMFAYSRHRETFLCPVFDSLSDGVVFSTMLHEFFHTLAKDTILVRPFDIFNGEATVLGYKGLSVYLQRKDGTRTFMWAVEEGSAEVCTAGIIPGYKSGNPLYAAAASKVAQFVNNKMITLQDLITLQKESNFKNFCARTMNKPLWLITNKDIEFVIKVFMFN